MFKWQRHKELVTPVDQHCRTIHGVLLIGCFVLVLCGTTVSSAEDTSTDSPSWSSLRQNGGSGSPSAIEPLSFPDQNRSVIRQAPALTGRFQLKDQTIIPFIGAGFGGGYTNDRDRALGSNGLFHNPAQSGDLGKNMMPNEFNLGVRIPF
ncbi:hypothetical protein [Nitrospira sp. Nam80]